MFIATGQRRGSALFGSDSEGLSWLVCLRCTYVGTLGAFNRSTEFECDLNSYCLNGTKWLLREIICIYFEPGALRIVLG